MSDSACDPRPPSPVRRAIGSLRRIARTLALFYIGIVVLVYFLQGKLIFPGASSQGMSHANLTASADTELVHLTTASGERVVVLYGSAVDATGQPHSHAATCPTVLFCYGNGTSLAHQVGIATDLRRMGANVLVPEYVGYGMSTGRPSERGCNEAAAAAYVWVKSRPDIDQSKLIFAGWSLGAAVAIDLASHETPAALVLLSPFTSLVEMGQRLYPILPVRWLLAHRFENIHKAPAIACPVLVLHGSYDSIIPIEMGRRLAAAFTGQVTFGEIADADHNDLFNAHGTLAGIQSMIERVASGAGATAAGNGADD